MYERQLPAVPDRLQWLKDGVQCEAAVEIESAVRPAWRRDGDAWTHLVVPRFEERHDDVEAVGGAALEDGQQDLTVASFLRGGAKQPGRGGAPGADGDRGGTKKRTSSQHRYLR